MTTENNESAPPADFEIIRFTHQRCPGEWWVRSDERPHGAPTLIFHETVMRSTIPDATVLTQAEALRIA